MLRILIDLLTIYVLGVMVYLGAYIALLAVSSMVLFIELIFT